MNGDPDAPQTLTFRHISTVPITHERAEIRDRLIEKLALEPNGWQAQAYMNATPTCMRSTYLCAEYNQYTMRMDRYAARGNMALRITFLRDKTEGIQYDSFVGIIPTTDPPTDIPPETCVFKYVQSTELESPGNRLYLTRNEFKNVAVYRWMYAGFEIYLMKSPSNDPPLSQVRVSEGMGNNGGAAGRQNSTAKKSTKKSKIRTGPRGGKYYIKNGRKVYV